MRPLFLTLVLFLFTNSSVMAADVIVEPNQAKLEINGAVCAYCAYGMQKGLSKMDCVDKTQGHKGIETDIDNQIITIHLIEGKKIDLKAMSKGVRESGYEPRNFHMRVKGQSNLDGDRIYITDSNNERLYELTGQMAKKLEHNKVYDLQLLFEEDVIKALNDNDLPLAQIKTIIEGE